MRGLVAIAIGIVAVVVISVVAVAAAGAREPTELEEGSPEAAVQEYLLALEAGDVEAAYAMFSASVQEELSFEDFERSIEEWELYSAGFSRTVYFDHTEITGDSARVYLTVEDTYPDGGFVAPPTGYPIQIRMVNESGAWRIDEPLTGLDPYFDPSAPF